MIKVLCGAPEHRLSFFTETSNYSPLLIAGLTPD